MTTGQLYGLLRKPSLKCKGLGEGGRGARASPLSKVGGTSGFVPPHTFWQSNCSNFTICSYFVVKKFYLARFARQL